MQDMCLRYVYIIQSMSSHICDNSKHKAAGAFLIYCIIFRESLYFLFTTDIIKTDINVSILLLETMESMADISDRYSVLFLPPFGFSVYPTLPLVKR